MISAGLKTHKSVRVYEAGSLGGMKSRLGDQRFDVIVLGHLGGPNGEDVRDRPTEIALELRRWRSLCQAVVIMYRERSTSKERASETLPGTSWRGFEKSVWDKLITASEEEDTKGKLASISFMSRPQRGEVISKLAAFASQIDKQFPQNIHVEGSEESEDRTSLILWAGPEEHPLLAELERACQNLNKRVMSVESAQHALREARRMRFEASFVHDALTDMAGLSLVRSLRREIGDRLPIAYVASVPQVSDRLEGVHAGVSLYINEAAGVDAVTQSLRQLQTLGSHGMARVLVIDDDEAVMADLITAELSRGNFSVSCLTSPLRALELLSEVQTDLLLIHADMQTLGGFELCRTIRAMPEWQALPIILVGEREDSELRVAAYRAGADDYLMVGGEEEMVRACIEGRLERSRLVQERADRDGLTGLLIRRAFNDALMAQMASARRRGSTVAVCLIDLDHFKSINDTYGHVAGDRVLSSLGRLLSSSFRVEDLRGRWGGEEFVVAFSDESAESAKVILERARHEFTRFYFDGEHGERFQATFSAGIACYPEAGNTIEDVFKVADRRLYAVKEAGRNSIFCDDSVHVPTENSLIHTDSSRTFQVQRTLALQSAHSDKAHQAKASKDADQLNQITAVFPVVQQGKGALPAQASDVDDTRAHSPLPRVSSLPNDE